MGALEYQWSKKEIYKFKNDSKGDSRIKQLKKPFADCMSFLSSIQAPSVLGSVVKFEKKAKNFPVTHILLQEDYMLNVVK